MRSSSGSYVSNLDHLRALAAFQVFVWHFTHTSAACASICFARDYTVGALSIFEEGHTGVSLFMCISGYIFARLTDGHAINAPLFWFNRAARLLPLLAAWSLITIWSGQASGIINAVLAPGGWSIVVEMEFYLLFPFMLLFVRRFGLAWIGAAVVAAVALRYAYWLREGSVQDLAYWTLAGRIDQLLIGYLAFYAPTRRPAVVGVTAAVLLIAAYAIFNALGGFYGIRGYPSRSVLWVVWPLLEALCYSAIIRAYVGVKLPRVLDAPLARVGTWSYSIYLGHFYFVPVIFFVVAARFGMPESFGGRLAWALAVFPLVVAIGALTYTTIEKPFLALRKGYLKPLG